MKEINSLISGLLLAGAILFVTGCNNSQPEKKETQTEKKDSVKPTAVAPEPKRGPVINIGDTLSIKRMVLVMKDSAATFERVSLKLGEIYGAKLGAFMKKIILK